MVKPIILLTAYGNAAVDAAATEIGANDYLAKGEFDAVILDRAVRYATRQTKHCGLTFNLHLALGARRLPPDVEIAIYRGVQEAITNVVRHAEAKQVGIILEVRNNEVICIIEDDGRGIASDPSEPSDAKPKRLGLLGMRERLAPVHGTLELESARDHGATVFLRVPISAAVTTEGD